MNFAKLRPTLILALVVVFLSVMDAYPCSRVDDVSSTQMVKNADAIVRASAVEYALTPRDYPTVFTSGEPDDAKIRFKVLEVISRHDAIGAHLARISQRLR